MGETIISRETTREMQLKGLEMLLHFDKFCTDNDLLYYFCGGCCIGTIRHGGFIPWDDDVDVFMPRDDYEKLKKLWKDTDEYSIQYTTETYLTHNQFATICANNTAFIRTYQKNLDVNHGLMLDVIPLDGCPTGWRRKKQKLFALAYSLFIVGQAPENHGKVVYYCGKFALGIFRGKKLRYRLWRFCERQMTKYSIEDCDYITELCSGPHYMKNEYPKEYFSSSIRKPFEGYQMPIPVGYDGYLKIAFGDYMTLPPEEKQICHHEYEHIDMNNSYLKYRGTKYFIQK